LVGALAVDGNEVAGGRIGQRPGRGGRDGLREGEGHIALGVGRAHVIDQRDRIAQAQVRAVHHQVIADLGAKSGRARNHEGAAALRRRGGDLAQGSDVLPVRQPRKTLRGRSVAARILRRDRSRICHRHRDFLGQVFLKQARGRHGVPGQHILPHDLRRAHGDGRDRPEHETGDGQRGEDLD